MLLLCISPPLPHRACISLSPLSRRACVAHQLLGGAGRSPDVVASSLAAVLRRRGGVEPAHPPASCGTLYGVQHRRRCSAFPSASSFSSKTTTPSYTVICRWKKLLSLSSNMMCFEFQLHMETNITLPISEFGEDKQTVSRDKGIAAVDRLLSMHRLYSILS